MPVTAEELGITKLSVADRLDLIEQIWDSLPPTERSEAVDRLIETSPTEPDGPTGAAFLSDLKQRSAAIDAGQATLSTWREVKARVRGKLGLADD
jgi:putative addiction module component (TIGR02574 family)